MSLSLDSPKKVVGYNHSHTLLFEMLKLGILKSIITWSEMGQQATHLETVD